MTNSLKQYVSQRPTSIARLDRYSPQTREDWLLMDALLGGTATMREAGERYLPRFPAEEAESYDSRLKQSTLYNVVQRTLNVLASKPFQAPPVVETTSSDFADWMENVDLQGRNLATFARSLLRAGLAKGLAHVLVDFPRAQPGATLADERALGARPYFTEFRPEDVLGYVADKVNGYERLVALRLATSRSAPSKDDPFTSETIEQRLEIVRGDAGCSWQLKEKAADGADFVVVAEGMMSVPEIPFVTFYAQRVAFMSGVSPLLDLAYLNVQHWQSSSDQDNILHIGRVPVLFASGFQEGEDVVIGAKTAVRTSNTDARLAYVEHSGAAVEAGRVSLQDLEARMAALGAELLLKRQTGDKSATEAAIESAEATCDLAAIAEALEDTLNLAFDFMAQYVGAETLGTVTLFKDFAISGLATADLNILMQMNAAGIISRETVFKEAQRRDVLSDETVFEDEQAAVEDEQAKALEASVEAMKAQSEVMGMPAPGEEEQAA